MYVVTVRGLTEPIRCENLIRCPLKPENLMLVDCGTLLSVAPHPPMKGDWSLPAELISNYVRGVEYTPPAEEVLGVHGPTPEPPEITAMMAERARRAQLSVVEPEASTEPEAANNAPVPRKRPAPLGRKPRLEVAPPVE